MKKKILLASIALVAISFGVVGISAFEAHVINVTAQIENALYLPLEANGLSFGTVFPEEVQYQNMDIQLSQSFLDEPRVDDVEYMIRQKPKCGIPIPRTGPDTSSPQLYSSYVQVTEGLEGTFVCPPGSDMLPILCPYLSKHEVDGKGGIDAFHGPLKDWTMADTIETQLLGRLSKADNKTSTSWVIDLHAPCFKGMCAQDNVIPVNYQADPAYEHQIFGCDLWVEVTNISLPPDKGLLTVIKHVINDDGTGSSVASNFTMNVTGINPVPASFPGAENPGVDVILGAGSYSVDETGPGGYTKTLGTDCSGSIAVGEHKYCTITNDDNATNGTITVNKVLDPSDDPGKFDLQIDSVTKASDQGNGGTTGAISLIAGAHTVGEVAGTGTNLSDYTTVISGDCASDGSINLAVNQNAVCTITNTRNTGTITIIKVVNNNDVGTKVKGNFQMRIDGNDVAQEVAIPVTTGNHTVSEANNYGYTVSFSGDCDTSGIVNVGNGQDKTCTVTNTMPYGTITVNKVVTNDNGGLLTIGNFTLKIDAITVTSGSSKNVAAGAHTVSEVGVFGYSATFSGDCNSSGNVSVAAGENKTCTITNNDIAPSIELVKIVFGGSADPDDFDLSIDGNIVTSGSSNSVMANTAHVIDEEVIVSGYSFTSITGTSFKGVSCPAALNDTITLLPGDVVTCTITNTL